MTNATSNEIRELVDGLYRSESRRVFATLVRLLGDFDLAEDAMHDAFAAAIQQWAQDGPPRNPRAWLVSTGRFKAVDQLRRRARFNAALPALAEQIDRDNRHESDREVEAVEDDQLRLIFTCCHPALPADARLALTLREVCGLTTEEIAHAFLTSAPTIAQRIVRAKAKIRTAGIPYQVPSEIDLPERLSTVLHVISLVFNEGYSASSGASLTRSDISNEAIRLGRLLLRLLPEPEVMGLVALMLLNESRHTARTGPSGDLILLQDQDRSLWDREQIAQGIALVEQALPSPRIGPYTLQAAIAAVHAEAVSVSDTDWPQISALYSVLAKMDDSPVVALNRAVAVAMCDGAQAGLDLIEQILVRGDLQDYHLAYSARAGVVQANWGELPRRARPMNAHSPLRSSSRNAASSSEGLPSCCRES